LLALFTVANFAVPAAAQSTRGSLTGLVSDPNGAAVVAATVIAKNIATGEEAKATTSEQGAFVFPSLLPGKYRVTVEASGFKRAEVTEVTVEVSTPSKINVPLEVGEVSEQVTVTGETQEVINTVSPVLGNTINTRQVKDLPLPSRNPLDLARLQAGIATIGDDTRNSSVGGLRGTATNVTHDGVNAMDNFVKTSSFFAISSPSLNATSEFSIQVGTVGSDAGRGVAQVRLVTPSGTNGLHGSAFWQHRNDNLNANTFFNNASGTERERQLQNFFGFSAGGPVLLPKLYDGRNKSFWFFSYEGFREPFSVTRNRTVLTDDAKRGIFRYLTQSGGVATVNLLNIGTFNALNPLAAAQLNLMPSPNNTLVGDGFNTGGFRFNVAGVNNNDRISIRADQNLFDSSRLGAHKLEWVFHRANFILTPDTFNNLESPFPGGLNVEQSSVRTLTAAAIHSTFGSSATNEVRFGHQRAPVGFLRTAPADGSFFLNFGSVTDFQNSFQSQGRNTLVYHFQDNFSLVRGAHTFRTGAEVLSTTALTFNDAGIHPLVDLTPVGGLPANTANPTGIAVSEFPGLRAGSLGTGDVNRAIAIYRDITGHLISGRQTLNVASPTSGFIPGATRARDFKQREASFYFTDQWRMRRNFTLTYGMRYEFLGVPTVPNGLAILPRGGVDGLFGISGPGNLFNPGVLRGTAPTPIDFVSGSTGIPLYNNDKNNFAPTIGFAWSPSFESGPLHFLFGSEGRTSIRAGYSISYLRDGFTVVSNTLGVGTTNPGLIQIPTNANATGTLTAAGVPLPPATFRIPVTDLQNFQTSPANGIWTFDPNLRVPYVQQWSFGIEREIAPNTALEIRYVGNHAVKVYRAVDFNEANIFENGVLNEFLTGQRNLAIHRATGTCGGAGQPLCSFGNRGLPGQASLPNTQTLFGSATSALFTNSTFVTQLDNNNVGDYANTLAFNTAFAATRGLLSPNFFVANPNAAFARVLGNSSYSNYHSLQTEIRRRFSNGLSFQANYTFSKTMTDSNGSQSTLESFRTLRNLALDSAVSDQDQRHRFIANAIYDLPLGNGRRYLADTPVISKVLEGWTVATIVNTQSSNPFYVTSNRSTFNNFNAGANPAQLVGISFEEFKRNVGVFRTPAGVFYINPNLLDIRTDPVTGRLLSSSLKPGLLGVPAPGTFGNFPINSLAEPRFFKTDFTLAKRTRFKENANFEFRVTFLNAFNNSNFNFGNINFDDATFGLISAGRGDARIIHFYLGFNW
jgi:hypothetical protein